MFSGPMIFMKRFPYKDIKRATDGFHRIMYTNSHIVVYKARFQDGGVALVKEIRDYSQAEHVFYREMQLLGRLHHRHLLALRGFSTGNKRFGAHLFPLFHFFLISPARHTNRHLLGRAKNTCSFMIWTYSDFRASYDLLVSRIERGHGKSIVFRIITCGQVVVPSSQVNIV